MCADLLPEDIVDEMHVELIKYKIDAAIAEEEKRLRKDHFNRQKCKTRLKERRTLNKALEEHLAATEKSLEDEFRMLVGEESMREDDIKLAIEEKLADLFKQFCADNLKVAKDGKA